MMAWNSLAHSVESDVMFEVVEISDACFVHLLLQYTPHIVVNRI